MRHKSKTMLTALFAVFAFAAVASASASAALPEFVPAEGAKFPITFQDAAQKSDSSLLAIDDEYSPRCTGSQVKGEITAAKVASVTLELTGCYYAGAKWSTGRGEEGKETMVLPGKGTLVYINKAEKRSGFSTN
jgi:hypothetical protein